ncbi:hypothetical protein VTO42DRAFT_1174 [Malbranchea cinnamomea]
MAPMAVSTQHHHRSTTKKENKPFKSKHLTKGALKNLNKGKVELRERGSRKTPHQQLMTKLERKNQARQKQRLKRQAKAEATSIFSGQNGAPRHIAVIPLAYGVNTTEAISLLNQSVDVPPEEGLNEGIFQIRIDRFKQNVAYIPAKLDLISALDACRIADFVVFVLPADETLNEQAQLLLRSVEGQGISNVLAVVQGLEKVTPQKRRQQIISSLKSFMNRFFPALEKVHSLDSRQECSNIVRGYCAAAPKGIHWRDDRSWMLIENVVWPETSTEPSGTVVVTGVVRGRGLKADRLVHIPGWGDYQISAIDAGPRPRPNAKKGDVMNVDDESTPQRLDEPTADADDLATVAPEDVMMTDDYEPTDISEKKGVLIDDHHYFSEEEEEVQTKPRRLPKGTSSYQAAWYLDDISDSGSDIVDEMDDANDEMEMDTEGGPEDGVIKPDNRDAMTEAGASEYPQSEMFLDPSPEDEADQIEAYRASRKKEAEEDLEFPDEIELHPQTLARERLARYRGLKSFKTSRWATEEDRAYEPEDWRRLLQVADYKGWRNQCIREALVGGVAPGTRVHIHLRDVPLHLQKKSQPISLFSLLRHEHKHAVVNFNMILSKSVEEPVKSKDELIIQCGPRRLVINPIFSASGNTPNNVHKFDRYLHPGRNAVATYIGPVSWGAIPVLVFRKKIERDPEVMDGSGAESSVHSLELIGTGTTMPPDQNRVVAKRVILTGHPYKIHKRVVTVRYMFFNAEDVNWFKALQLWTKRGRTGYIKESLGTHGYFKATFDGKINPQDAVGISLYKRVFPRKARDWESEA